MKSPDFQVGELVIVVDLEGFRVGTGRILDIDAGLSVVYEVEFAPGDRRRFPENRLQKTDARAAGASRF